MANKRLSELVELQASEISADDLFLAADVSVKQSKKVTVADLAYYILSTGSFDSSVYTSVYSDTASYINPSSIGLIPSSSYSFISQTTLATTIPTASLAYTASYFSGTIVATDAQTSVSSSWASSSLSASFVSSAKNSDSSSFLIYATGINNGRITNSDTASLALLSNTSSFSEKASQATNAISSLTSETSSYSSISQRCLSSYVCYGPYTRGTLPAISQSAKTANSAEDGSGIYDGIKITPIVNDGTRIKTYVSFFGDIVLPVDKNPYRVTASLSVYELETGTTQSIDVTYPACYVTNLSAPGGSIITPIHMRGFQQLSGSYLFMFNIEGESGSIDQFRDVKFYIEAPTDNVSYIITSLP